jgi:glycosyltransferase involved in cell wall biosynthesis
MTASCNATSSLAIVIITKNQEWNIARLIESVLENTAECLNREIVVADSASVDRTLEIAADYPIRIIRLRPDQRLTAAAGRYVGYVHTTAEYVLFLDGDMELCDGWLEKAWSLVQTHSDLGVVTGQLLDLPLSVGDGEKPGVDSGRFGDRFEEVLHCGGAALYRRAALNQAGTFCPYLYSEEEPELCIRIRHAGYRVAELEHPIAYHYSRPEKALSTLLARRRRNLYLGFGQNIRYHLTDGLLWPYLRERGYGLAPGFAVIVILGTFAWSVYSSQWFGLCLLLLVGVLIILGDALWRGNLYQTAVRFSQRLVILEGMIRGLLMKPLTPDVHPIRYDAVEKGPQAHERRTPHTKCPVPTDPQGTAVCKRNRD